MLLPLQKQPSPKRKGENRIMGKHFSVIKEVPNPSKRNKHRKVYHIYISGEFRFSTPHKELAHKVKNRLNCDTYEVNPSHTDPGEIKTGIALKYGQQNRIAIEALTRIGASTMSHHLHSSGMASSLKRMANEALSKIKEI